MTGTGTQADPFYPTNWDEFVTAIGQSGVYIECPENAVWDMNEMLPDGLKNGIGWLDSTVHGNGLTIKNLYFNGGFLNLGGAAKDTDIHKLNFLNMSTSGSNNYIFVSDGNLSNKNTFFRNCKFSGSISSSSVFRCWQNRNQTIVLTHDGDKGCSLNFEFAGNGTLIGYKDVYFRYCNIKLDGQTTAGSNNDYAAFEKCYLSGKVPWGNLAMRGYDNIFDIEIPNGTTINNNTYDSNNSWKTNVLNSDKMHGEYTSADLSKQCLAATTEQLSDAAYLQSIGFSIAAG